jgi:hypothetical protein
MVTALVATATILGIGLISYLWYLTKGSEGRQ